LAIFANPKKSIFFFGVHFGIPKGSKPRGGRSLKIFLTHPNVYSNKKGLAFHATDAIKVRRHVQDA
jgi:hypothetical protein